MGWANLNQSLNRVAFARLGSVSISAGAVTGLGFLSKNSELVLGGQAVIIDYLLKCLTSEFGGLSYGDTIQVAGTSYKVEQQPMQIEDGLFCIIPLFLA